MVGSDNTVDAGMQCGAGRSGFQSGCEWFLLVLVVVLVVLQLVLVLLLLLLLVQVPLEDAKDANVMLWFAYWETWEGFPSVGRAQGMV